MAEGGQSDEIVKRLNDTLECSICMGQYTDPRILDCLHSFCLKCITGHVGDSPVIKCPLCNDESSTPSIGVEGLKSNFFIKGLIEDVMCKKMDDADIDDKPESKAKICGSCDEGNLATSHCDDCECELCAECVQLHAKLKALRTHQVKAYPTEEELQAQMEAEVSTRVSQLTSDIGATLSDLQVHIEKVKGQMEKINNQRDATVWQVQKSKQQILDMVDRYVTEMNAQINENADKRLGDLPDQLNYYEKQQTVYNTLQKQAQSIHDLEIERKLKLSKELKSQLEEYKGKNRGIGVAISGTGGVSPVEFVAGVIDDIDGVEPIIRCGMGFLKPTKYREERSVGIVGGTNKMQEFAIQCAHNALDEYDMNSDTTENMNNIAKHIQINFTKRYRRGTWNCFVWKGIQGCCFYRKTSITLLVDNLQIMLFEESE